jgi:phosphatidylserine decarboxylase
MRFAREAWPFVLPPALAAAVLFGLGHPIVGAILALLAFLLLLFFRDPSPGDPAASDDVVLAPAWGKVLRVEPAEDPAVSTEPLQRIVIFLSVFDVHLQRAPVSGKVVQSMGNPGRRVAAFRHDAGNVNAGHLTVLEAESGDRVGVRQIVGLLARRIVCYLRPGQRVRRGETLGLIKFGSRVDLLLPRRWEVLVEPGARVTGGSTAMARIRGIESSR